MSFLNRMMASIGVGSAKVDTRVENAQVRAGEELRGVVHVRGGSLEQKIDSIYVYVMTQYIKEVDDKRVRHNAALSKVEVTGGFTVGAGETREFPFAFQLPDETPASVGRTPVWLKTGLDIEMAVDPTDEDRLHIMPHRHSQVVLDGVAQLGFQLRQAECEYSRRFGRTYPFIQEFEFVPMGRYRGRLDELEVICLPHAHGVDVIMEIDRRARGFTGLLEHAFGADERLVKVEFGRQHLQAGPGAVAGHLEEILARYSR